MPQQAVASTAAKPVNAWRVIKGLEFSETLAQLALERLILLVLVVSLASPREELDDASAMGYVFRLDCAVQWHSGWLEYPQ